MKKMLSFYLILMLIISAKGISASANETSGVSISAPSAILMDFSTGQIIYEKNPDERLPLASVTKIMTMLLAMEEIDSGRMSFDDIITASAHAKSYGGSTIFLEEGEQMSVRDIMKGVAVASGNDAAVALGEHISGTEDAFVVKMNQRAKELGMGNTNFVNCNGLDADGHYSTARDIALMSRELMKHSSIFEYTTIWMDSLRNGEFTLSNTNKLVRFYEGCTGLKTGSTGNAKFCISATAKRGNLHLIAVIMAAETSKQRQADASTLLNYGFGAYDVKTVVTAGDVAENVKIEKSKNGSTNLVYESDYNILCKKDEECNIELKKEIKKIKAPANKGDNAGSLKIFVNGSQVHELNIVCAEDVTKISYSDALKKMLADWVC